MTQKHLHILPTVAPSSTPGTAGRASQFTQGALDRADLAPSPITQFHAWFSAAQAHPVPQAESCCLSTASLPSGRVSARFVYFKELDEQGFVVYSNFGTSRKAKDLETNAFASLTFWWRELERQVRIEGRTERLKKEESQRYYATRARGSKIGAWASQQSSVIEGRQVLEEQVKEAERKWQDTEDDDIEVPDFWGGLRIIPEMIEFWQGRDSRLHDRFTYVKDADQETGWKIERLSP